MKNLLLKEKENLKLREKEKYNIKKSGFKAALFVFNKVRYKNVYIKNIIRIPLR